MLHRGYRKVVLALGLFALLAAGCTGGTAPGEDVAGTSQALEKPGQISLSFPAGYSHMNTALYATEGIRIDPGVVLADATGAPAAVVSVGERRLWK